MERKFRIWRTWGPGDFIYVFPPLQATAQSPKEVEAADIFGFVKNSEANSVLTVNGDGDSRTVIGSITDTIPKGKGNTFLCKPNPKP